MRLWDGIFMGLFSLATITNGSELAIITESLPSAVEMQPYHYQLTATNMQGTVVWGAEEVALMDDDWQPFPPNTQGIKAIFPFYSAILEDGTAIVGKEMLPSPPGYSFKKIAKPGYYQTGLGLTKDGHVIYWDEPLPDSAEYIQMPPEMNPIMDIALGQGHFLALEMHGKVHAWGFNDMFQCNVPETASNIVAIAASDNHSIALRKDGAVIAWGEDYPREGTVSYPRQQILKIATTRDRQHLALKSDGTLFAWSDGTNATWRIPPGLDQIVDITHSSVSLAALTQDGRAVVWDSTYRSTAENTASIAGNRYLFMTLNDAATRLPEGLRISPDGLLSGIPQKAGLYTVTLLLTPQSGASYTSKTLELNVLPNPDRVPLFDSSTPDAASTNMNEGDNLLFTAAAHDPEGQELQYHWTWDGHEVASGTNNYLHYAEFGSIGEHELRCYASEGIWQNTTYRQWNVHIANTEQQITTTSLPDAKEGRPYLTQLEATNGVAPYSWTYDDPIIIWDENKYFTDHWIPKPDDLLETATIDTGFSHYMALLSDGTVTCWGRNDYDMSVAPSGLTNISAIAADCWQSLVVHSNGTVSCWGHYGYWEPVDSTQCSPITNAVAVAGGGKFSLALLSDGRVMEWGMKSDLHEVQNRAIAIAAGIEHALILKDDGTVIARGANNNGQCDVPTDLNNVIAISADRYQSMALKADGTVVAWGEIYTKITHTWPVPTIVPEGLQHVVAIAAGTYDNAALLEDGTMISWDSTGTITTLVSNIVDIAAGYGLIALKGRPAGLDISTDGTISGVPKESGTNIFTLAVTDAQGETTSKQFELFIQPDPNQYAPVIDSFSPSTICSQLGYSIQRYSVVAHDPDGDPLTYTWAWDGHTVASGTNNYHHGTTWSDTGIHTLQCSVSDPRWPAVYATWTVEIIDDNDHDGLHNLAEWELSSDPNDPNCPSPIRAIPALQNRQISLLFQTIPQQYYYIYYCDDLSEGIWQRGHHFRAEENQTSFRLSTPLPPQRFYRIFRSP